MPDGDVTISLTLETSDIRRKANSLRSELESIFDESAGANFNASLKNILAQMDKLYSKSTQLEQALSDMDNAHLESLTEEAKSIQDELIKACEALEKIDQQSFPDTYNEQLEKVMQLKVALDEVAQEYDQVAEHGSAGMGYEDYDAKAQQLNEVNNQMAVLVAKYDESAYSAENSSKSFSRLDARLEKILSGLGRMATALKRTLVNAFNKVKRASSQAFSFKDLTRGIRRVTQLALGVYSVTALFNKLKSAIKEGTNNLVQFQSDTNATNQAMTEFKTSLLFIQNAWGAAFAPVLNVVQPILTSLMDTFAEVGNAVARFFATLTGQTQVIQALRVSTGDYAKSLKNAGGAAKKLQDRLAAFDDLNVLGKDDDSGGYGGGAYSPSVDEMFEYVDAQSSFAEMLKDAWENQNFTGVGETIKNKIIEVLKGIDWDEIKSNVSQGATFAGQFLVGLFGDPELFKETGRAIGEGFNTINLGISSFLDEVEKIDFGGNLAEMLNEFLKTTDFELAGENINRVITDIINNIDSFVSKIDADEVAKAIEDFINGLDVGEILATATKCVVDVASLIIRVTGKLALDWGNQLGDKWLDEVQNGFQTTIDGESMTIQTDVDYESNPLIALVDTWFMQLGEHISKQGYSIASVFTSLGGVELTESDYLDLLSGSWDGFWDSLWNTDRETEIGEMGKAFDDTSTLTSEDLSFLGTEFTNFQTNVSETFTQITTDADGFKTQMSEKWDEIKGKVSETWENIKTTATEKWTELKNTVTTKVQEIKDKVSEKFTALKDKLTETWQNIKDAAYEKFVLMRVSIIDAFNTLKEALKTPINAIIGIIEGMVNKVIDGINVLTSGLNTLTGLGSDVATAIGLPSIPQVGQLQHVTLPRLAQGAVIPPNKEFMAVLGDQSSGTNIEAPLDTIKQAVAEVVGNNGNEEVIALLQQLIGVVESKNLVIGDKEIGKANARYVQSQNLRRGTSF